MLPVFYAAILAKAAASRARIWSRVIHSTVIALDGLDVQAAVFILARMERQEIPPFPARDEHAALNLRLVFVGHSFEPGADVDGFIEWTLRLNAAVLANQAVRRAAQPVVFWMNHKARLDDGIAGQNFVKVVTRLLDLGTGGLPTVSGSSSAPTESKRLMPRSS